MWKWRTSTAPTQASTGALALLAPEALTAMQRSAVEAMIRGATTYAALDPHYGLARVLGRYKVYVNPQDDAISSHLILDGFWEMWNTIFLAKFITPGLKIIEIGSNLGYFSLLLSELTGPNGRVVGFEPLSLNADLLERTMSINGFGGRFRSERKAVSDTNGAAQIYVPRGNWGGGSIVHGAEGVDAIVIEEVETITLDSYCAQAEFWPDFVKSDAEGAERLIWAGMRAVRTRSPQFAFMFEFDPSRTAHWRDWFRDMESEGFHLYRVGFDSRLEKMGSSSPEPLGMFEVLALRGYNDLQGAL
ncbi:MAG: FkbM family methyltransferase [Caulobacterales bacterium]